MSKEAMGQNGAVLGSNEYWHRATRSTCLAALMRQPGEFYAALQEVGTLAGNAVEEICRDLQENAKDISTISESRRNALEKQVRGLYDVCKMAGKSGSDADTCISLLRSTRFSSQIGSAGQSASVQTALRKVKNNAHFFSSECVELLEKASDWGIGFAAGSDQHKREFLEDVAQGKGKPFLQEVLEAYRSNRGNQRVADTKGRCGYEIGSHDYLSAMERSAFKQDIPMQHSARWGSPSYTAYLKDGFTAIAHELERDLEVNARENNYVTDRTAEELRTVGRELERCGARVGMLDGKIEKLNWFVGGDPSQIRQLQSKLNSLGVGERLTEDGVYGKKTAVNVSNFYNHFLEGSIPSLNWINPLQTEYTGISIGSSRGQWNNVLQGDNGFQYFRVDPPHPTRSGGWQNGYFQGGRQSINYNHINVDFPKPLSEVEDARKWLYNHYPLTDQAYDILSNMEHSAQMFKIAGKAFLITGVVADVMELVPTIEADLHDADGKLGSATDHAVARMEGRWSGAMLGGSMGAKYGALIGSAICPGVGTAIGGFAGGLILGIVGSYGGEWVAQKVIDVTEVIG